MDTLRILADIEKQLTPIYPEDLFFDWMCSADSLYKRGVILMDHLVSIMGSQKFEKNKIEVLFKNNCFGVRQYYDDFRLCEVESGQVIYTVIPKIMYPRADKGKSSVYGKENDFQEPLVIGTWEDVKNFFMNS